MIERSAPMALSPKAADGPPFRVEGVSFRYGGSPIIQNVSFVVDWGDFVGIIGPNGSGKSTLLKLLLGLLKPTEGAIEICGTPLREFREWRRIGYVSQRVTHFDPGFPATVWEVVSQGRTARAGLFRRLSQHDRNLISSALEEVGMLEMKQRLVGTLSGGQQQRVFIARALAQEPDILVLDEPTIGVDPEAHQQFFHIMRKLHHDKGLTILIVSHEVDVMMEEVTKLVCLNRSLLFSGTPEQCLKDNCLIDLYGEGFHRVTHAHPWTEAKPDA
ncbi:MAG: metal ABC transporter ATP-binding protein [Chloroflexi bacterium]|nr:metal ABC transporter ATP-binding protein [Chloroflexota bacterium]